ncbi:MAG: hypothetical protein O3B31_09795 [Chloroflexi bacterium]|nr:hypothetical protein [Chloroflexota bacterium]MDA1003619.1 hypothetical protein [Chloroflexota bacterium]
MPLPAAPTVRKPWTARSRATSLSGSCADTAGTAIAISVSATSNAIIAPAIPRFSVRVLVISYLLVPQVGCL